jgi:RNA polymerase sigma-70 factor (ECF subfamily)
MGQLAGLLKRDVVLTMPPLPLRSTGRKAVTELFASRPAGGRDRFRHIPTRASRQPALAFYRLDPDGQTYRAQSIWVLCVDGDAIAEIAVFQDPRLVPLFGLPAELAPEEGEARGVWPASLPPWS